MHPSSDLTGLGPGECANSPSLALSPCHSSITHPRSSPHPTSDSSRTLVFYKRPPILPLSIETSCFDSHTSAAKIVCPSDSSEPTGLHSTGADAPNTFKPLEVRLHKNKIPASESYGVPGMDNSRPSSTLLSEVTSFDRIKLQLEYGFSSL